MDARVETVLSCQDIYRIYSGNKSVISTFINAISAWNRVEKELPDFVFIDWLTYPIAILCRFLFVARPKKNIILP